MESNELCLSKNPKSIVEDFKEYKQNLEPQNQQHNFTLSNELKNAMQDRQWKSLKIQNDLESIRKFSILHCIRERVFDVLSQLPLAWIECLCQQDIDGLIRRNLLRERKVRFNAENEYEGEEKKMQKNEEEIQKENILEEMDVVLKVLGNDKCNKLVIENFELLEERIARVEQRLSSLVRRLPNVQANSGETTKTQIKIDMEHVRMDIQNFVDKFNQIFTCDYELTSGITEFSQNPEHTLSSTNHLKFQMLSRLPEMPLERAQESSNIEPTGANKEKTLTVEENAAHEKQQGVTANLSDENLGSKTNQNRLKAVDSLITLRERFKMQSAQWLDLATNKTMKDPADKKTKVMTGEAFFSKGIQNESDESITAPLKAVTNKEVDMIMKLQAECLSHKKTSTILEPRMLNRTSKELKEINTKTFERQNKSVQTASKTKRKRSKSNKRQKSIQQLMGTKEIWVQYVNSRVLGHSDSKAELNEPAMDTKDSTPPAVLKANKTTSKIEKNQKKSKQPKCTRSPSDIKDNCEILQLEEPKANEQPTIQLKQYKRIFLLKIPKSSSKQHLKTSNNKNNNQLSLKKTEANASNTLKVKSTKKNSLIRLFPKTFKPKTRREQKQNQLEEKAPKPVTQAIIPSDSLQKLAANQFLNKIRNRWIFSVDQNGRLVQKKFEDFTDSKNTQNEFAKNRKLTQKPKKKKSDSNGKSQ